MRSVLAIVALLVFSIPATANARPPAQVLPAQPIHMASELDAILKDLHVVKRKMGALQGDFRTMQEIDKRLKAMETRLARMRNNPHIVTPQVVVQMPTAPAPVVVVHHPAPHEPPPVAEPVPAAPQAMAARDFNRLLKSVAAQSFASERLDVVRTAATSGWYSISQVSQLVDKFSFGKDRLELVRVVNSRIVDPENAFQLYEKFTYSSDKKKLRQILGR